MQKETALLAREMLPLDGPRSSRPVTFSEMAKGGGGDGARLAALTAQAAGRSVFDRVEDAAGALKRKAAAKKAAAAEGDGEEEEKEAPKDAPIYGVDTRRPPSSTVLGGHGPHPPLSTGLDFDFKAGKGGRPHTERSVEEAEAEVERRTLTLTLTPTLPLTLTLTFPLPRRGRRRSGGRRRSRPRSGARRRWRAPRRTRPRRRPPARCRRDIGRSSRDVGEI